VFPSPLHAKNTNAVGGHEGELEVSNKRPRRFSNFANALFQAGRFKPIFSIREIKVVGFSPKSSAAPSTPLIFQPVFCRTAKSGRNDPHIYVSRLLLAHPFVAFLL
jgi:hypothetical protein